MNIRHATYEDLKQIANVHITCFPDSFSTQLGKFQNGMLQQSFYLEYLKAVPELFLVAEDENSKIIGFCMGYYLDKNDYMKKYFRNNFLKISFRSLWLLLSGNKAAWQKISSRFKKSETFKIVNDDFKFSNENAGDLLSICVLPEYRGQGAAQLLIEKYQEALKKGGKEVCLLSVALENGRGVHFYEKNGFVPYKEVAGKVRTYAKYL